MKLLTNRRTNLGTHFKRGDLVKLNKKGQKHSHLFDVLFNNAHKVQSVKFTDNLDYVDQFVYLDVGNGFYNTCLEKI